MQTTIRKTTDIIEYEKRWGAMWTTQFAYELGCDMLDRMLIEEVKEERKDKLLKEKQYYESLKKIN